jgi:CubicO group peptidase (beta-lactamase class C family)
MQTSNVARAIALSLIAMATACAAPDVDEDARASEQPFTLARACDLTNTCRVADAHVESWVTDRPEAHDLDGSALTEATRLVADNGGRCLLVVRDGRLVHEAYRNGATAASLHDTFSIAKTFTSALVGVAIAEHKITSAEAPAAAYVPEWRSDAARAPILLRHLLTGASGLRYSKTAGSSVDLGDYSWLYTFWNLTDGAIRHPIGAAPDTEWRYNNHAVQVLGRVIETATGENAEAYAREHLWRPIGMASDGADGSRTHWKLDHAGNPVMFSSVYATCRGLAKFGQLLLQAARWNDAVRYPQVAPGEAAPLPALLDAGYVKKMLASRPLNGVYGYLTWLNRAPAPGVPALGNTNEAFAGQPFTFAPEDMFSAEGVGQNFIDVIPSTNTVIVHIRPLDWLRPAAILADGQQNLHREILRGVLGADSRGH